MHSHFWERLGRAYRWSREHPLPAVLVVVVAVLVAVSFIRAPAAGGTGVLEGTVTFIGLPCRDSNVPPCSGPYPDYEVGVYAQDGRTYVASAIAGGDGRYSIRLEEGNYVVYSPSGPVEVAKHAVSIAQGRTTILNLTMDTGIR
jgi:hypothetical protein